MLSSVTQLSRFKDLILTLMKFGFEDVVDRLEVPGFRKSHHQPDASSREATWVRMRRAMEHMGPTFVKLGQVMSLRSDLLPPGLLAELSKLQDQVGPEEFEAIEPVIAGSLGKPLEEVFSVFDRQPLAAASLSQVHRAVLADEGVAVAVKVQRPGIRKAIKGDLEILKAVARRLDEKMPELHLYDLPRLVEATGKAMINELDFKREAANMKIARSHLGPEDEVAIPAPFERYSGERLLVMELAEGERLEGYIASGGSGCRELAVTGLQTMIRQILEHGFFHADPHPGNILVSPDQRMYLIDWGMVGRLTESARFRLLDVIRAVVGRDAEQLTDALLEVVRREGQLDRQALELDVADILDAYHSRELQKIEIGRLMFDLTRLVQTHGLRMPPEFGLMVRALVTAEGTARRLDPELNVIDQAEPLVRQITARRYNPARLWRLTRRSLSQILKLQAQLPKQLSGIAEKLDAGDLSIRFEHHKLEGLRETMENASNRLTFGIIIAAMLIGSSMIITTDTGPRLFGFPALGVVGYIISGLLGVWVLINILRSRRF